MMLILLLWEFTRSELWLWFMALSLWRWALVKFWLWLNIVRYICTCVDKAIKYLSLIISVIISDLSICPFSILNYRFFWLIMIIIFIAMSSLFFHLLLPYSSCIVISSWGWVLLTPWQWLVTIFISVNVVIIIIGSGCCVGTWTPHTLDLW